MKLIPIVFLSILSVCCSSNFELGGAAYTAPVPMTEPSGTQNNVTQRKVVKRGRMSVEVRDVKQTTAQVEAIVKNVKGRIEEKSEDENVSMEIRIPSSMLESVMDQFSKLGEVTRQRVWTDDVTEKWIDTQAKLKSLRALRSRLQGLYAKASKVEELLKIEKELARVQGEIDSIEGRMRAMQRDVALSKIDLTIKEKSIPGPIGAVGKGMGWITKKLWVLN